MIKVIVMLCRWRDLFAWRSTISCPVWAASLCEMKESTFESIQDDRIRGDNRNKACKEVVEGAGGSIGGREESSGEVGIRVG